MEDWNEEYGKEWKDEFNLLFTIEDGTKEDDNVSALIVEYALKYICKESCRTSEKIGHSWMQGTLLGHPICYYEMFRVEKHVFYYFCTELVEHGLEGTKQMRIQEMVAIFLNMIGHGVGNRMIQERFQHSGEIVSRHFHTILDTYLRLSFKYIKPSDPMFHNIKKN